MLPIATSKYDCGKKEQDFEKKYDLNRIEVKYWSVEIFSSNSQMTNGNAGLVLCVAGNYLCCRGAEKKKR